jgi:hypothetical protein
MKILAILFFFAALFAAWWLFGGGAVNHPDLFGLMPGYRNKAADEATAQYNLAKQQGDQTKVCEQAGVVAAAFLQAQDQNGYNQWKAIEAVDCSAVEALH